MTIASMSTPRHAALAGLAVLLAAAAAVHAEPARAHGESTTSVRAVVDRLDPPVAGVEAKVLHGQAAALAVRNRTGAELVVIGDQREPFLRIGPRGVLANLNSRTWYRSGNPDGVALPPDDVRIGAAPRWRRVARRPAWTWFDHRMHPGTVKVPREAAEGRRTVRLDEWAVPMRLGSRPLSVKGHVEFRPLLGAAVPELTSPAELAPSVFATILRGRVPGIYLQTSGRERVAVTGREGEPFARIGRRGVEVNLRSPTHVEDRLARGQRPRVGADPRAAPLWKRVSDGSSYAWLDARARYPEEEPPEAVVRRDRPAVLSTWRIPVTVGQRRLAITGRTRWLPTPTAAASRAATAPQGDDDTAEWAAGAILLAGIAGLAVAVRLRRRPAASRSV